MQKRVFYAELAYVIGITVLALSAAMMEAADFGVSMVVAPAYLIHLTLSPHNAFFTFGTCEYLFQAFLLLLLVCVLRRFKLYYLFSFVTAVIYGLLLDMFMGLVAHIPMDTFIARLAVYAAGVLLCAASVSLLFHTYVAPEVYELVVKELAARHGWNINVVKTCFDCLSCAVAVVISFCVFGWLHFEGVKAGTIVVAFINGWLIGRFSHLFEKLFVFRDALPLRRYFE